MKSNGLKFIYKTIFYFENVQYMFYSFFLVIQDRNFEPSGLFRGEEKKNKERDKSFLRTKKETKRHKERKKERERVVMGLDYRYAVKVELYKN